VVGDGKSYKKFNTVNSGWLHVDNSLKQYFTAVATVRAKLLSSTDETTKVETVPSRGLLKLCLCIMLMVFVIVNFT